MKRLFLLVSFLLFSGCAVLQPAAPAPAIAYTYAGPQGSAVLFDAPCTKASVLRHVPQPYHFLMKAAEGTFEGEKYDLCWAEKPDGSGDVVLQWEDGSGGGLSRQVLKPGSKV